MSKRMKGPHDALLYALSHHAQQLAPLVNELSLGYALYLQPNGWELDHSKKGANSYSMKKGWGLERHFRGVGGNTAIAVYDRYFHGNMGKHKIAVIRTRMDARQFIRETAAL